MTNTHRAWFPLALVLSVLGCAARPATTVDDAAPDAYTRTTGPSTFTITLDDDDLVGVRGDRIPIGVHVVRQGGFDEPVLVELAGLPDPLTTQARESRVGDATTTLTILTDEDGDPIQRSAFVVQASSLEGLRQTAPAHITVE